MSDLADRLEELLKEIWEVHADPADLLYNECDTAECAWCEDSKKVIAALRAQQEPSEPVVFGGPLLTFCPQCGINIAVDEDGCCMICGATATGPGVAELGLSAPPDTEADDG